MFRFFCTGLSIFVLFLFSCTNPSRENKSIADSTLNQSGKKYAELQLIEDFYDFGSIVQGEVVKHTFNFRNAGGNVLIIKDLIPDCGCTKPTVDKTVLKSGEEGAVEVIFDSNGWQGSQYKSVTLRTNSPIREKSVTIKVNVVPPKD